MTKWQREMLEALAGGERLRLRRGSKEEGRYPYNSWEWVEAQSQDINTKTANSLLRREWIERVGTEQSTTYHRVYRRYIPVMAEIYAINERGRLALEHP